MEGKVIWITGASSGIGASLATMLADRKARLILTARRREPLLEMQRQFAGEVVVLPADLSAADTISELTQAAIQAFGRIDIVIHAAGVGQRSLAIETPIPVYRQIMEVNFFAPVAITRYLLPFFKEQGHGQVVVISSMSGLMGYPGRTGYAASKHALMGFFETMQVEHTLPDFHITIVSPGRVNTPLSLSAITASGAPHHQMDAAQLNGIPVRECAQKILKGMQQKRKHVIIARKEKYLYWLRLWCPPLYYRIARASALH